jgi:hypothetical protein
MIKEALEYVVDLSGIKTEDIGGITYSDKQLRPIYEPAIEPIELTSLQGLMDYIASGELHSIIAPMEEVPAFIHVASSSSVSLLTNPRESGKRDTIIRVTHKHSTKFSLGTWLEPEDFIVQLKSNAVPKVDGVGDYLKLLTLASSISTERIATMKDTGVNQQVATRQGIAFEMTEIPQFLTLEFRRTFPEIFPGESKFFLRVKDNQGKVVLALFECTFDEWEMQTRAKIKSWIASRVDELKKSNKSLTRYVVME